jgi:hypothetical protein
MCLFLGKEEFHYNFFQRLSYISKFLLCERQLIRAAFCFFGADKIYVNLQKIAKCKLNDLDNLFGEN